MNYEKVEPWLQTPYLNERFVFEARILVMFNGAACDEFRAHIGSSCGILGV